MKKKSLLFVLIIWSIISLSGCKKEEFLQSQFLNGINVKVEESNNFSKNGTDSWLYFSSVDDYESTLLLLQEDNDSILDLFEKSLLFTSLRSNTEANAREMIGIEDDVLATLLSPQMNIRIGDTIFHVNMPSEYVVLYDAVSRRVLDTLSVDQDIYNLNETKNSGTDDNETTIRKSWYDFNGNNPSIPAKCWIKYTRCCFYFSLKAKIYSTDNTFFDPVFKELNLQYCCYKLKRDTRTNSQTANKSGYLKSVKEPIYHGTKRVEFYDIQCTFFAKIESAPEYLQEGYANLFIHS